MATEAKAEQQAKLAALKEQAQRDGFAARDYGYGVLVICLREYAEPEQLPLAPAPASPAPASPAPAPVA